MNRSEFALASLVMGITSFIRFFNIEKGIVAILFGVWALKKMRQNPELQGRKLAISGISLGIISIILTTAMTVVFWPQMKQMEQQMRQMNRAK